MVEKVAEDTVEYVTTNDWQEFQSSIDERLTAIEDAFNQAVASVKADSLKTLEETLEARLERERKQRESDIESLKGELRSHQTSLENKLDGMKQEFDTQFKDVNKGMSKITGLIESLPSLLEARDKQDAETHRRIEHRIDAQAEQIKDQEVETKALRTDVDLVTVNQANANNDIRTIRKTIHGDPENKDDAPSLFGMMTDLKEQVGQGFMQTNSRLDMAIQEIGQNRSDIAVIVEARANEKAQWEKRWAAVKEVSATILKNRWVQLAIGAILASVVLGVFPELRPAIVQQFLDSIQSGG